MACSSTCPTGDHESFGACIRAKGLRVAYCQSADGRDYTAQKREDRALDEYATARAQGVQPHSIRPQAVRMAMEASERSGRAFDAGV